METVLEKSTATTPETKVNRKVKKVAVLGSGVMGSRIAAHFANIGVKVLLLDIVPRELSGAEKAKGVSAESKAFRNRIVNDSLQNALKSRPASFYDKEFVKYITTGNFEDDMKDIADADWVLEAVIENLDIKKKVFENVEKYRKEGSIISTNTSSIPIYQMLEGRSEDFQQHFMGTHFFNPPRYLRLLEIIPTENTKQEVIDFLMEYGSTYLGKTTVLCKDTTAFIANRIGVFGIMYIFHLMKEMNMTVEEIDALTGPVLGRPKSATFRTCDVVGIDTLVKVATIVYENCDDDERRDLFKVPEYVSKMVENNWLGDKSGQGFYKMVRDENGKTIYALDINTMEYRPKERPKFATLDAAKPIDDLKKRLKALHAGQDKAGEFLRKLSYGGFQYVSNRIPEIADELYKVDDALNAGFGWELGPFATWDVLGVGKTVKGMEEAGLKPALWVYEMLESGADSFYKYENGVKKYYDVATRSYKAIPGQEGFIILENLRGKKPVFQNSGTTLHDIGEGVLNLEFHTKMNSIGGEVIEGINKSIEIAEEKGYTGLVIGNEGQNFSAGANVGMIFMLAVEQEYDELNMAIKMFQNTIMRVRHSAIPVVVAPHGLTLGGGCEMTMHADTAVAAAETYIGLVEVGIGVIPAGAGTKETVARLSDNMQEGDVLMNRLQQAFVNIATAKVATSAYEGYGINVLRKGQDRVVVNQNKVIAEAKREVLALAEAGYTQPARRDDIFVLGRTGLGALYAGTYAFNLGGYATDHDKLVAQKLAYVMCGGDLSSPQRVSDTYLLDLEREAFLSLLGEKKTLQRIESILKTGKPLRN